MLCRRLACCSRYVCKHGPVVPVPARHYVSNTWSELDLHPALLQRLADVGFTAPTDIQRRAIPAVVRGEHTICHAETGSGKTLCYLLPLIHKLLLEQDTNNDTSDPGGEDILGTRDKVQKLVFVPTPELGQQIKQMFEHVRPVELGKITPHLWDGLRQGRSHVDRHSPLILTTFSKLKDYDYYKLFGHIPSIVLDEADIYHTAGLKHLTYRILGELVDPLRYMKVTKQLPKPKQLVYVAATLNTLQKEGGGTNLQAWLKFHHISPVHAKTTNTHILPHTLDEFWRYVPDTDFTYEVLQHLEEVYCSEHEEGYVPESYVPEGYTGMQDKGIRSGNVPIHIPDGIRPIESEILKGEKKVLIFLNSAESVDVLYKCIVNYLKLSPVKSVRDFSRSVYRLSGSLNKEERAAVIKRIQRGSIRVLVASDVASRGLDIPGLDMVINAQLPVDPIGYLHRAGRTARMGRAGQVLNFLSLHDVTLYNKIENVTSRKIPKFDNAFKEVSSDSEANVRQTKYSASKKRAKKGHVSLRDPWLNDNTTSKFVSKIYRNEFEIK